MALPRKNAQELRSYRYFLDVTAPAIAGVFEVDFWLTYIPQSCHFDSAIWHAVVSLGAVHEDSVKNRGNTSRNVSEFALKQFNAAISQLLRPPAKSTAMEDKWRALTASVVFTYLCSFQGLHAESKIHLDAAKNLIEELQGMETDQSASTACASVNPSTTRTASSQLNNAPVPFDDLFSVVACLEITAQLLHSRGATDGPELLSDADAYITWRTYSAPSTPAYAKTCGHGRCFPSRGSPVNLNYAGKAIASLLNGLMALSQRDAGDVARLVLQGEPSVLATLIRRQQPYIRAFRELSKAVDIFSLDTSTECSCFGPCATPSPAQKKAVDVLRMYHAICYPLFLDSPTEPTPLMQTYQPLLAAGQDSVQDIVYQRRRGRILQQENTHHETSTLDPEEALAQHFSIALSLAESILPSSTPPSRPAYPSDFIPSLPTTTPLLIMAHISGIPTELRRRVIALLREYPQQEALMESTFAAALCELILGLEASDRHGTVEIEGAAPDTALANKVYGAGVTFTRAGRARVAIQTWDDWLAGRPGREEVLRW